MAPTRPATPRARRAAAAPAQPATAGADTPARHAAPAGARVNLSAQIRLAIETQITSGQLVPGARIDEQALMERFQVSRTPAREALLQLMSTGLVVPVPRQGAVVAGLSAPEYVALLEVLVELEGLAARLAARRMPAVQRRQLESADAACRLAALNDDPLAYARANHVFHETIYDGSLNDVLARQLRAMRLRMRQPQANLFDRPGRIRSSLAEHGEVLRAILDGDEEAAHRAMTGHIAVGGNSFADAIARMPNLAPGAGFGTAGAVPGTRGPVVAPAATAAAQADDLSMARPAPEALRPTRRRPPAAPRRDHSTDASE